MISFFKHLTRPTPRLHVDSDIGDKHRPTIVLLHGIAATSHVWQPLIEQLDGAAYRIITLDLLGFGASPKPDNWEYTTDDHVRTIRKTLKRLRVRGPILLVGHSMGSLIALRYARTYPRRIAALHLLSPPLYSRQQIARRNITQIKSDFYLNFYHFLSKKKSFTLAASRRMRKLLPIHGIGHVTEDTWESFRLSLINTIIKQRAYVDIEQLSLPIYVTYGLADELLVAKNIDRLKQQDNVTVTRLIAVNHVIGSRFAKSVAQQIENSPL